MAYYSWSGINIKGEITTGKQFARSIKELDNMLLKNEIALIKAKEIKYFNYIIIFKSRNLEYKIIENLHILTSAGLRIEQALNIIKQSIKNYYYKLIINEILKYLYEGYSLYSALETHKIFDTLTRSIINVGEKSSNLNIAFEKLSKHNNIIKNFKKSIKNALLGPILTFIFFILISAFLFIFVIPKFENIFTSFSKDRIPKITQRILNISRYFRSFKILYHLLIAFIMIPIIIKIIVYKIKDNLFLKIPVISRIICLIKQAELLQSLDLLLNSEIPINKALDICKKNNKNMYIKKEINNIIKDIENGIKFSNTLIKSKIYNSQELITLIQVGESSGNINITIDKASIIYQNKIYELLNKYIFMIQPILLIILGFLISCLIFAIYIPILNLSSSKLI